MWQGLVQMANDQFDTPPFQRLLNTKFSRGPAQQYSIQMAYYVRNRLLMRVAQKYATTEAGQNAIIKGARESLLIDRVYRGHLAEMLHVFP
jgi:hypothetical protein